MNIEKMYDELQGEICNLKRKLAEGGGGSGGVTFHDLIDAPITAAGNISVEDMSDADFICFGVGVTASGYDQIFESYISYAELKRTGTQHFVGGTIANSNGVYSAWAQVKIVNDTVINVAALTRNRWAEAANIYYIRKVKIV